MLYFLNRLKWVVSMSIKYKFFNKYKSCLYQLNTSYILSVLRGHVISTYLINKWIVLKLRDFDAIIK